MRSDRIVRLALVVAGLGWMGACLDPGGPKPPPPPAPLVASNPILVGMVMSSAATDAPGTPLAEDLVYVSLAPGTIPHGGLAVVRNLRTGGEVPAAMVDGGFDPVPIESAAEDTLVIEVEVEGGGSAPPMRLVVPKTRRPVVVRTVPPPRKRDVPLNAAMIVVFSEPMRPSTVTGIRVLQGGASVGGSVVLSADGLRATFTPSGLLAPNTDYVLSVSTAVTDVSGDPLEQAVAAEFTTGTTAAVASVATDPVALITNYWSGELRTFAMSAILHDDGHVTGDFSIYYAEANRRLSGRVTCFAIVGGNAAWVAGVAEEADSVPEAIGVEFGWRAVDNGPPEGGVSDQLSLAHPFQQGTLTAQDFCATTPLTDPNEDEGVIDEIVLVDLLSGSVVVTKQTP